MQFPHQSFLLVLLSGSSSRASELRGLESLSSGDDDISCEFMKSSVQGFLGEVKYSKAIQYALSGLLPPQFASNVEGRVQPVGSFTGGTNTLEYFYGLAIGDALSQPDQIPTAAVLDVRIKHITCDEDQRIASYLVDLYFGDPAVSDFSTLPFESSIRQTGTVRFNTQGKICGYEANLERLGSSGAVNPVNNIQQVCGGIMAVCTGGNQQFDSFESCIAFMTTDIPFGSFDNADINSVTCRTIHLQLALIRPDVHCVHTGQDGGGKCIDKTYSDISEKDFLFGSNCD